MLTSGFEFPVPTYIPLANFSQSVVISNAILTRPLLYVKVFNGSLMPQRWSPRLSMTYLVLYLCLQFHLWLLYLNFCLLYDIELLLVLHTRCRFILRIHAFLFLEFSVHLKIPYFWLRSGMTFSRQSCLVCQAGLSLSDSHGILCIPLS